MKSEKIVPLTGNESIIERLKHFTYSVKAKSKAIEENRTELAALLTNSTEITIQDIDIIREAIESAFLLTNFKEEYEKELASIERKISRAKNTNNQVRLVELQSAMIKLNKRYNIKPNITKSNTIDRKLDRSINAYIERIKM